MTEIALLPILDASEFDALPTEADIEGPHLREAHAALRRFEAMRGRRLPRLAWHHLRLRLEDVRLQLTLGQSLAEALGSDVVVHLTVAALHAGWHDRRPLQRCTRESHDEEVACDSSWSRMTFRGVQHVSGLDADPETGAPAEPGYDLELRDCRCGSTLARRVDAP